MRVVALEGSAANVGERHGSALSTDINGYLNERLKLAGDPYWSGRRAEAESIVGLAESTIESHRQFSEPLFEEMTAMAKAAGISTAEAIVVGGFTDLIDLVRAAGGPQLEEDDCTGVIDAERSVLAQTWDMHASAGEFVYMFDISLDSNPRSLVQTTAGCLGQMGMNEAGIAVGINNLTSIGKVGVTWPFVVRKVMEQSNLDDAVEVVMGADLAGGHNFFLLGPDGEGCNVEAMPHSRRLTKVTTGSFAHTNHCLAPETQAEEGDRNPIGAESSVTRLLRAVEYGDDLAAMFDDSHINRAADSPHDVATCGAVVMNTRDKTMEAVWGQPGEHEWEHFEFA